MLPRSWREHSQVTAKHRNEKMRPGRFWIHGDLSTYVLIGITLREPNVSNSVKKNNDMEAHN